jgi:hypothetical protein
VFPVRYELNLYMLCRRKSMLGVVSVPTAWRVLGLRMEERPPAMEVSCLGGLGVGLTTPHHKKKPVTNNLHSLGPGRILWINDPSYGIWI